MQGEIGLEASFGDVHVADNTFFFLTFNQSEHVSHLC